MAKKTVVVIGGAGFIGTNLIRELMNNSDLSIICVDNYINSKKDNIKEFNKKRFKFYNVDMAKLPAVNVFTKNVLLKNEITEIWHLAANSDIQLGTNDMSVDFKNTFLTTKNLLCSIERYRVKFNKFLFASSSAVYGYHKDEKLFEESGPLLPISNYGAMKLASEALISAFQERNKAVNCYIYRFPNVVGVPATHGVMLDFLKKINRTERLDVLGDGSQLKQYLHVRDLVEAMIHIKKHSKENINLYNIGNHDSGVTVKQIAKIVIKLFEKKIPIFYGDGDRGWIGDVPKFEYSVDKLNKIGWSPKYSSLGAIKIAANEIFQSNVWRK